MLMCSLAPRGKSGRRLHQHLPIHHGREVTGASKCRCAGWAGDRHPERTGAQAHYRAKEHVMSTLEKYMRPFVAWPMKPQRPFTCSSEPSTQRNPEAKSPSPRRCRSHARTEAFVVVSQNRLQAPDRPKTPSPSRFPDTSPRHPSQPAGGQATDTLSVGNAPTRPLLRRAAKRPTLSTRGRRGSTWLAEIRVTRRGLESRHTADVEGVSADRNFGVGDLASSCSTIAADFASAVSVLDVFPLFPPWLCKLNVAFHSMPKPEASDFNYVNM